VDVTETTELRCVACRAPLLDGDRFCEQCGARLTEEQPEAGGCQVCGAAAAIDNDGYCSVCGARERSGSDRIELDLAIAAAVSDRGRVHRRNEDAFQVEVIGDRSVAAVVCDGISSASAGDVAARSAAGAAAMVLAAALADPTRDASTATLEAIAAAHDAVEQVPWTTRADRGMPSCTLVAALCRNTEIVVSSVGDSRAYWIDSEGTRLLTVDDSWAQEQVAEGLLTSEQAFRDPRSHAITHWIGADAPDRPPRVAALRPDGPGRLLLCTDGLWNYVATAAELGELIDALPTGASPAAVARALADIALHRGGRDNITVAVVDIDPS
jgi:serine/threonine protein phosphatase PrpC